MVFLAHHVDIVPLSAQRFHDQSGPEVTPRTFQQVSMQQANHAAVVSKLAATALSTPGGRAA
jgi:hypothetical protein